MAIALPGIIRVVTQAGLTLADEIYSLGVCMLEILMQEPLIFIDDDGLSVLSPKFRECAIKMSIVGLAEGNSAEKTVTDLFSVREVLMYFATEDLPYMVGETLSELVSKALMSSARQFSAAPDIVDPRS